MKTEAPCTATFDGNEFTSGGYYQTERNALVYVGKPDGPGSGKHSSGTVTSWHGEILGRYRVTGFARGFGDCKLTCYSVLLSDGTAWYGRGSGEGLALKLTRRACNTPATDPEAETERLIEAHQEEREDWSSRIYRGAR